MTVLLESLKLKKQINLSRDNLIQLGQKKGLNHPETVKCSQELDKLIIEFQVLISKKEQLRPSV